MSYETPHAVFSCHFLAFMSKYLIPKIVGSWGWRFALLNGIEFPSYIVGSGGRSTTVYLLSEPTMIFELSHKETW